MRKHQLTGLFYIYMVCSKLLHDGSHRIWRLFRGRQNESWWGSICQNIVIMRQYDRVNCGTSEI